MGGMCVVGACNGRLYKEQWNTQTRRGKGSKEGALEERGWWSQGRVLEEGGERYQTDSEGAPLDHCPPNRAAWGEAVIAAEPGARQYEEHGNTEWCGCYSPLFELRTPHLFFILFLATSAGLFTLHVFVDCFIIVCFFIVVFLAAWCFSHKLLG